MFQDSYEKSSSNQSARDKPSEISVSNLQGGSSPQESSHKGSSFDNEMSLAGGQRFLQPVRVFDQISEEKYEDSIGE